MGTRSQTIFIESWKDEKTKQKKTQKICVMYRQMDGYPSGHGADLADFLKDGKLVNGINGRDTGKIFNGVGCLTAQVIAYFKDGPGSIYIHSPETGIGWEDYVYEVEGDIDTHEIVLRCFETKYSNKTKKTTKGKKIFEGHPKEFNCFVKKVEA